MKVIKFKPFPTHQVRMDAAPVWFQGKVRGWIAKDSGFAGVKQWAMARGALLCRAGIIVVPPGKVAQVIGKGGVVLRNYLDHCGYHRQVTVVDGDLLWQFRLRRR